MSHIRRRSRAAHFGVAIVVAVAATMAVPLFAVASPAAAAAPTPITTCNYTITTPGRYVVTTDLTCVNQFDFGIVIEASNVNLTLNGHTINGQSPANSGIFVDECPASGITDVRIAGPGTITGFIYGVGLGEGCQGGVHDSTVSGLTITDNFEGVILQGGNFTGNVITGNTITDNGDTGIYFAGILAPDYDTTGNMISNNTVTDNNIGIVLNTVTGSTVRANNATGNSYRDLWDLNPCGSNVWKGNTFNIAFPTCIH